ncbi:hypothetical protein AA11825_2267 [Acetobacter pomorum DSM 11825]|nr:hypothetical protein AA11825_2267 [Acetobacter pomorum DSM 11825]
MEAIQWGRGGSSWIVPTNAITCRAHRGPDETQAEAKNAKGKTTPTAQSNVMVRLAAFGPMRLRKCWNNGHVV